MIDTDQQDPNGERKDEDRQHPRGERTDADMHYPFGAPVEPEPPSPAEEPALNTTKRLYIYAAVTIGVGVLIGMGFAVSSWLTSSPPGTFNLGQATAGAQGLTGQLFTEWNDKLIYRLTIGPTGDEQHAGFALAVSNPPRPVSFDIQVKDPLGFVLCSKTVVLRYDPSLAAAASGQAQDQAAAIAQMQAQELARERGKDIFQNALGPDGKVATISAQGDIPCTKKAYEKAASWSFSTDFPALAEQAELLKRQAEAEAKAERLARQSEAARKKAKRQAAATPLHFAVEGYDRISWSDPSLGVVGTDGGKTFVIDQRSRLNSGWQAFPANIHYTCDQNAACTITRTGSAVVLHARLRR